MCLSKRDGMIDLSKEEVEVSNPMGCKPSRLCGHLPFANASVGSLMWQ